MTDEDIEKTVHCDKCDEQLIAMFAKEHKCDEDKLKSMVANSNG